MVSSRHDPISLALMPDDFRAGIVKMINLRYTRTLKNINEWDSDKVLEIYLSALAHCYDPHSDYEDREDLENFSIQMGLTLFGIGAVLTTTEDGMYCEIKELNPSGPAFKGKKLLAQGSHRRCRPGNQRTRGRGGHAARQNRATDSRA